MKVCYIAGKYRAKSEWELIENIRRAEFYAIKYSRLGFAVICPHKNTAHMGGILPDEFCRRLRRARAPVGRRLALRRLRRRHIRLHQGRLFVRSNR